MQRFKKILLQGATLFTVSFISFAPMNAQAQGYNQQGYGNQGGYYQNDNQGYNNNQYDNNQGYNNNQNYDNNQGYNNNQDYNNNQGYNQNYDNNQVGYNQPEQNQQPSGPITQVNVQFKMSGAYNQLFNPKKDKFQIFLRGLNNPKESTKGTEPVRLDMSGGQAVFDEKAGDQPKGLLVALSKAGENYQSFCTSKNSKVKDSVITGFPQQITVTLTDGDKPYSASDGTLRNDSYPNCEIIINN